MEKTKKTNETKSYTKFGIIAAIVVAVAVIGAFVIRGVGAKSVGTQTAISEVSADAANGADLRFAVLRRRSYRQGGFMTIKQCAFLGLTLWGSVLPAVSSVVINDSKFSTLSAIGREGSLYMGIIPPRRPSLVFC